MGARSCKSQGGATHERTDVGCQVFGFNRSNGMSLLIDDLSRIIASPIPRRQALRLAGNMLGGGILAYLGLGGPSRGHAEESRRCGAHMVPCGKICCQPSEICCGGSCYSPRLPKPLNCCGGKVLCSAVSQQCCTDHCCGKTENCCGAKCCAPGQACCKGQCCAPGEVCCNNRCVPSRPSQSRPCPS